MERYAPERNIGLVKSSANQVGQVDLFHHDNRTGAIDQWGMAAG
jgi:hypothetical protein